MTAVEAAASTPIGTVAAVTDISRAVPSKEGGIVSSSDLLEKEVIDD